MYGKQISMSEHAHELLKTTQQFLFDLFPAAPKAVATIITALLITVSGFFAAKAVELNPSEIVQDTFDQINNDKIDLAGADRQILETTHTTRGVSKLPVYRQQEVIEYIRTYHEFKDAKEDYKRINLLHAYLKLAEVERKYSVSIFNSKLPSLSPGSIISDLKGKVHGTNQLNLREAMVYYEISRGNYGTAKSIAHSLMKEIDNYRGKINNPQYKTPEIADLEMQKARLMTIDIKSLTYQQFFEHAIAYIDQMFTRINEFRNSALFTQLPADIRERHEKALQKIEEELWEARIENALIAGGIGTAKDILTRGTGTGIFVEEEQKDIASDIAKANKFSIGASFSYYEKTIEGTTTFWTKEGRGRGEDKFKETGYLYSLFAQMPWTTFWTMGLQAQVWQGSYDYNVSSTPPLIAYAWADEVHKKNKISWQVSTDQQFHWGHRGAALAKIAEGFNLDLINLAFSYGYMSEVVHPDLYLERHQPSPAGPNGLPASSTPSQTQLSRHNFGAGLAFGFNVFNYLHLRQEFNANFSMIEQMFYNDPVPHPSYPANLNITYTGNHYDWMMPLNFDSLTIFKVLVPEYRGLAWLRFIDFIAGYNLKSDDLKHEGIYHNGIVGLGLYVPIYKWGNTELFVSGRGELLIGSRDTYFRKASAQIGINHPNVRVALEFSRNENRFESTRKDVYGLDETSRGKYDNVQGGISAQIRF